MERKEEALGASESDVGVVAVDSGESSCEEVAELLSASV